MMVQVVDGALQTSASLTQTLKSDHHHHKRNSVPGVGGSMDMDAFEAAKMRRKRGEGAEGIRKSWGWGMPFPRFCMNSWVGWIKMGTAAAG